MSDINRELLKQVRVFALCGAKHGSAYIFDASQVDDAGEVLNRVKAESKPAVGAVDEHSILMDIEAAISLKWEVKKEKLSPLHRWLMEEAAVAAFGVLRLYLQPTPTEGK